MINLFTAVLWLTPLVSILAVGVYDQDVDLVGLLALCFIAAASFLIALGIETQNKRERKAKSKRYRKPLQYL